MKTQVRWWVFVVAVLGAPWLVGCGQKQSESSTSPAAPQQPTAQQSTPKGEVAGHEEGGEKITPAGSIKEIWGQIVLEQDKLSTAIQNGQLKDVHHLAFGIRDLAVALADKTHGLSAPDAATLSGLVHQVKHSASKLDELGDAGNLSGTQDEFTNLSNVLNMIKKATATQ